MDNKQLISLISKTLSIENREADTLCQNLFDIIAESVVKDEEISIPAFGTFSLEKKDEYIETDIATGKKTLFPPQLLMRFSASIILTKRLSQK